MLDDVFTVQSIYVVLSLIVIEGLLSVDNALAIAAMASHLDEKRRKLAMTIGYAGAYGFRILALFIADIIIDNHWLMVLGAAYLVWLMCNHFSEEEQEEATGRDPTYVKPYSFGQTIAMIALLDLSLSFDNVVAAIAFARDNIWMVYLGVTIGIITLRLVAGYCLRLLQRYPWLEHTAFILVGFVGALLCVELIWDQYVKTPVALGPIPIITEQKVFADGLPQPGSGSLSPETPNSDQPIKIHYHIEKTVKFLGIVLLILGHWAYEYVPGVRPLLYPFVKIMEHVFALVARTVSVLFKLIAFPLRWLVRARGHVRER